MSWVTIDCIIRVYSLGTKMLITCANLERGGVSWNSKCLKFTLLNFRKYASSVNPTPGNLNFPRNLPGKNIKIRPWITGSYVYSLRSNKSNISNTSAFPINNCNHLFNCLVIKKTGVILTSSITYSRFKLPLTSFIKIMIT